MVRNLGAVFGDRPLGLVLDSQVNLVASEFSKGTKETLYIAGAVGTAALVAGGIVAVVTALKRNANLESDSLPGSIEFYAARCEEAEIKAKENSVARKKAIRAFWETRKDPGVSVPYLLGGMVGAFLERPNSISDDEPL